MKVLPEEFPMTEDQFIELLRNAAPGQTYHPQDDEECPIAIVLADLINEDRNVSVGMITVDIRRSWTPEEAAVYKKANGFVPSWRQFEKTYATPDWAARIVHRVDRYQRALTPTDVLRIVEQERMKRQLPASAGAE